MKNRNKGFDFGSLAVIIALLSCVLITPILYRTISTNGVYPTGSDTMYHIFRGDLLYRAIVNRGGYPLFSKYWYNGIEPLRYCPPLSPILYAICQIVAGGKVFKAFIYYVCVIFVAGVFSWLYVGIKRKRPILGVVLGILWFFLPNNIYAIFGEGNLPRSLSMVFLPIALYSVYSYLDTGEAKDLFRLIINYILIVLCHFGYSVMIAIAILGYLIVQRLYVKNRRRMLKAMTAIFIAFLITGLFIIPSFYGGTSTDNAESLKAHFQSILITLDPFYRITHDPVTIYFGLSLFIIAVFGTLVSNKKASPGFLNAIIIVLLTTTTAYSIIKIMPGSNMMQMLSFLSIALCLVFLSLIYWAKLRKWILLIFIVLIAADCFPSLSWIYGEQSGITPEKRLQQLSEETYIAKAQELCTQRIALFDLSSLGAQGAYLISNYGDPKMSVFGAGWEAANTSENITRLNRAMNDEYFDYMFDRCIDLGADTIIIQKDQAVYGEKTLIRLDAAAERNHYDILYENDSYILYRLPVSTTYGTRNTYDAIGIGYSAFTLSFAFPNIRETIDEYIDHYSYEELCRYKTVYLSGFYYEDKRKAEELVTRLSENGVRVVILADGMPEDRETRTRTFLGVTCNVIQFENGYPILYTTDYGDMDCDLFPKGYAKWVTCYLNGLKDVKGTISDNNVILSFYGTGINENVCYVGLNIPFYYYLTQDMNAEKIMQWVIGMQPGHLPAKELYPIDITYRPDGISIHSDYDMVKTGIAFHDNFSSGKSFYNDDHILVVQRGDTDIRFVYPYFKQGILVTIFGILTMISFLIYIERAHKRDEALRAAGVYGKKRNAFITHLMETRTEKFSEKDSDGEEKEQSEDKAGGVNNIERKAEGEEKEVADDTTVDINSDVSDENVGYYTDITDEDDLGSGDSVGEFSLDDLEKAMMSTSEDADENYALTDEDEGYGDAAEGSTKAESVVEPQKPDRTKPKPEIKLKPEMKPKTETTSKPETKPAEGIKNKAAIAIEEIEAEAEKKTSKFYDFKTFDLPFIKGDDFDL